MADFERIIAKSEAFVLRCNELAESAADSSQREHWLRMAQKWRQFARQVAADHRHVNDSQAILGLADRVLKRLPMVPNPSTADLDQT